MVRKLKAVRQDLLHRMHAPVREQHRWLGQVLRGHYRYYGVIFNYRALRVFKDCVVRLWRTVLGKRSQKGRVSWASYKSILTAFPLPEPVLHQPGFPRWIEMHPAQRARFCSWTSSLRRWITPNRGGCSG